VAEELKVTLQESPNAMSAHWTIRSLGEQVGDREEIGAAHLCQPTTSNLEAGGSQVRRRWIVGPTGAVQLTKR
jgi:hypothetical protein